MSVPTGIDPARFGALMHRELGIDASRLGYLPLTDGRSNLSTIVTLEGGPRWVLRRPPLSHVGGTAHDVLRESRVMRALGATEVPVPRIELVCEDASVIGGPFFLMRFVSGAAPNRAADWGGVLHAGSDAVEASLGETLASIHSIDVEAVGLADLRREGRLLDRQLRRWMGQFEKTTRRELPLIAEVHERLVGLRPTQTAAAFTHGDFKANNLILGSDGTVLAVLDWELCADGEAMLDLGWFAATWETASPPAELSLDRILERYERASGIEVQDLDYYRAFALWKLACIGEGVYSRLLDGAMGQLPVEAEASARRVEQRADEALQLLRG